MYKKWDAGTLAEVQNALINDTAFAFKKSENNLRHGICPNCGEKECFVSLAKPYVVNCGRLNNCQWSESTRSLYPDIFENLSKRHPVTDADPNATARAYMTQLRGFDATVIKDMYLQGTAKNIAKEEYYPAVKIIISQQCYWMRIINADDVRRNGAKSKIIGKYQGHGWVPPGMKFEEGDEIWITEGIFKSISFLHVKDEGGKPMKSIAALSSSNLPREIIKANKGKKITWIMASDNDAAGIKAAEKGKKEIEAMGENCRVAFPAVGEDWDDVYRAGRLKADYINDSYYRGFYIMADSFQVKAFFHYCRYKMSLSIIDFRFAMYRYKIDEKKLSGVREDAGFEYPHPEYGWNLPHQEIVKLFAAFNSFAEIRKICPCKPEFLYIEKDIVTQERTNTFYIEFANHTPSMLLTTDGTIYKSSDNFSNGLLKHTGFAPFNGSNLDLSILHERWFNKRIKFVQGVPFVGYEPSTKIYIFPEFAYYNGQHQKVSKHGFFTFGRNSIKCNLAGHRPKKADDFNPGWIKDFYQAFDKNGMVLLSWWLGTLFAEQIRKKQASWPFLEYTGDPGAGKSTQLRFMWRCLGIDDYEGFDPNKSTLAGRSAIMSQGSNLPSVLLEADRHSEGRKNFKAFDFSELKNLYNGGTLRTMGTKTAGAEVREYKFRGGIVISQNAEVEGEAAVLERIVHCHCTKEHFTDKKADITEQLCTLQGSELGGFLHAALRNERKLLDGYFADFEKIYKSFQEREHGQVNNWRIILNHAQIAAWLYQLPTIFGDLITPKQLREIEDHIWSRAGSRQARLASDHPIVEQFWDVYDYQNEVKGTGGIEQEILNHSSDPKLIAINLPHFQSVINMKGLRVASSTELIPMLKVGKRYEFVALKPIRSKIYKKSIKCWVFRKESE